MNHKIVKILRGVTLIAIFTLIASPSIEAQCAMCRATLESNYNANGSASMAMNAGIFVLLSMPYLLVGGLAYVWYKNRKKDIDDTASVELKEIELGA